VSGKGASGKGETILSGTAEANSSVSVFDGAALIGTVAADSAGKWSLPTKLANGTHSFTETSTDGQNTASSVGTTLYAQTSHNLLQGDFKNDVLIAGPGDTLVGGGGHNTFVFNPSFGKDTIQDFDVTKDVLAFASSLFANATPSQVLSQTHNSNAGAVIVVDAHDTVTLTGVTVAQLHASDFQFF
jgi:hypothetical protein